MSTTDLITKFTLEITRDSGAQARIVAIQMGDSFNSSIDTYVLRRDSADQEWSLCSESPHPDWRTMSVDDYVKHGRSEKFRTVSHGELLKAISMIGKPINALMAFQ